MSRLKQIHRVEGEELSRALEQQKALCGEAVALQKEEKQFSMAAGQGAGRDPVRQIVGLSTDLCYPVCSH